MEPTVQELFNKFVADHGAEATVAAIKGHKVSTDSGGDCQHTGCPPHYICAASGNCVLDIG